MKLDALLTQTNDHAVKTISGGCIVHPSNQSRSDYYRLSDYAVSTASTFNLYLVPRVVDMDQIGAQGMESECGI